jgi:ParB family chromosome partitioning protein
MSKFNLTSLLNTSAEGAESEEAPRRPALKVVSLNVRDLVPSKENFYGTDDLTQLKASIEMFGVKQNLTVKPTEGGKYEVIAGHRRRLACLALLEEGKTEFEYVPCGIESERDELKERLLLIMTNSTTRELTDWERMKQAEELRALFSELKKHGNLPGRVRDMIADTLGMSATNVGRMDAISHNLTPEFQEEFKNGNVPVSTAYELSGLPESEQKAAFADYQTNGGANLKDIKERKKAANTPPPAPQSEAAPEVEPAPTTDELKPCPFCGGNGVLARESHIPTRTAHTRFDGDFTVAEPRVNDGWLIECETCGARGPHEYTEPKQNPDDAEAAWNKRAAD